ncbi:hypothetical protein D9613_012813 [Agrocybe pediades]|uniref:Uncharacterized protein n=1 Tax=Agrocybe pediades TaxID=84607 RepID=A0A8H4R1W6_9AGAR|nr:hypothetical protein D9613_012813 [Agrocybe pediades]
MTTTANTHEDREGGNAEGSTTPPGLDGQRRDGSAGEQEAGWATTSPMVAPSTWPAVGKRRQRRERVGSERMRSEVGRGIGAADWVNDDEGWSNDDRKPTGRARLVEDDDTALG